MSSVGGLQYVVLLHTGHGDDHFDIMLEQRPGGPLLTFRSPNWPIENEVQLTPLREHRREYLDYEGPVSGNRGKVKRVARGTFDSSDEGENVRITFRSGSEHVPLLFTPDARCRPIR